MTELEHKAAEAWSAVIQGHSFFDRFLRKQPMPPGVALDMVQDVCGDRDDALFALLDAGANWLWSLTPAPDMTGAKADVTAIVGSIRAEGFGLAESLVQAIRERANGVLYAWQLHRQIVPQAEREVAMRWVTWCDRAALAVRLGREMVAAAHPTAA